MNANSHQQQQPTTAHYHVCFGGTLACSGANPCPICLDLINREVLAQAMKRTTETMILARGERGSIAIQELDTRNFWAVFFGFYGEAWQNFLKAMLNDPEVARRAFDLRTLVVRSDAANAVGSPPYAESPAPAPVPSPPAPPALSTFAVAPPLGFPAFPAELAPVGGEVEVAAPSAPTTDSKEASSGGLPTGGFSFRVLPAEPGKAAALVTEIAAPAPVVLPAEIWPSSVAIESKTESTAVPQEAETTASLFAGRPADIRRAITADDIAAGATVLESGAEALSRTLNGAP